MSLNALVLVLHQLLIGGMHMASLFSMITAKSLMKSTANSVRQPSCRESAAASPSRSSLRIKALHPSPTLQEESPAFKGLQKAPCKKKTREHCIKRSSFPLCTIIILFSRRPLLGISH